MTSCIFCRLAAGELPARIRYADEELLAFDDLHPQAPVHLLLIPRRHLGSLAEAGAGDVELLGRLVALVPRLAREQGLEKGFRLVANTGPDGGQTVGHLHFHLLGGRAFDWPPG